MARRAGGTAEQDDMLGTDDGLPRQASTAERRAANTAMASNRAAAESRGQERNFFQEAGDFLFGDAEDPGLFGTGQYGVNAPEVRTGAGQLPGATGTRERITTGLEGTEARDVAENNPFRDQQMTLAGDLLAASRGEGPSVAQEQLRQGLQNNLAATVSAANSVRGPGGAAQAGQLMASRAMLGQQAASDAAVLRAREVENARAQLGQVTGQGRGLDQEAQGQKDEMVRYYLSLGLDVDRAEQAANMRMEELRVQAQLDAERLRQGSYEAAAGRRRETVQDVAGGVGSALGIGAGGKK